MNIARLFLIVLIFFKLNLLADFANCEYVEENKVESLNFYKTALLNYEKSKYYESYKSLMESYKIFSRDFDTLVIKKKCVNVTAGPLGAIRNEYYSKDEFEFKRNELIKNIKKRLPPRPLVVSQIVCNFDKLLSDYNECIEKSLNVSVMNAINTNENKDKNYQTPLSNFKVYINEQKLIFGDIESEKVITKEVNNFNSDIFLIKTNEQYGYQTAKFIN